ncbi:uncharacterized protein LOC121838509 [Ixodes scapularis]|nr:uncharacterized protein LOC121838509 [Ixodes scapularis]
MLKYSLFVTQMLPWLVCPIWNAGQFIAPQHDSADTTQFLHSSHDWLPQITTTSTSSAAGLHKQQRDKQDLRGPGIHAAAKMLKYSLFVTQMLPWLVCPIWNAGQFIAPQHDSADTTQFLHSSHDWLPQITTTSTSSAAGLHKQQRDKQDLRGPGIHAAAKMLKYSLFVTQVSYMSNAHEFRSDCRFLFVLPGPQKCHEILSECWDVVVLFCKWQLLLSGDVEENPGPDGNVEDMVRQILSNQNRIAEDIKEIRTNQENMKVNQSRLEASVNEINSKINKIEITMKTVQALNENVKEIEKKVQSLEKTIEYQNDRLTDFENRSRRNNLLVFGIPEVDKESEDDLKKKVIKELFEIKLGVQIASLERIHRVGYKRNESCRPVIIKLFNYNEKLAVLKNCRKLKGTKISVSSDYARETREKRKKLWNSASENKANGDEVFLVHDKLKINNQTFEWDLKQDQRFPTRIHSARGE